eukprot:TRINITY_DN45084_c0_g1_i1.p1 TRINITY_DN45084_c0_g1~~TRINITY_DN45084_c0_g1_i1.p1  ORF type:complete len:651 (-),score=109.61 TRINITY_DN45084_c0_g1_i1:185-2137(-)
MGCSQGGSGVKLPGGQRCSLRCIDGDGGTHTYVVRSGNLKWSTDNMDATLVTRLILHRTSAGWIVDDQFARQGSFGDKDIADLRRLADLAQVPIEEFGEALSEWSMESLSHVEPKMVNGQDSHTTSFTEQSTCSSFPETAATSIDVGDGDSTSEAMASPTSKLADTTDILESSANIARSGGLDSRGSSVDTSVSAAAPPTVHDRVILPAPAHGTRSNRSSSDLSVSSSLKPNFSDGSGLRQCGLGATSECSKDEELTLPNRQDLLEQYRLHERRSRLLASSFEGLLDTLCVETVVVVGDSHGALCTSSLSNRVQTFVFDTSISSWISSKKQTVTPLRKLLGRNQRRGAKVIIFSFGELDCRRNADQLQSGTSAAEISTSYVAKIQAYVQEFMTVAKKAFIVPVVLAVPSPSDGCDSVEAPCKWSLPLRAKAAELLNQSLETACLESRVEFTGTDTWRACVQDSDVAPRTDSAAMCEAARDRLQQIIRARLIDGPLHADGRRQFGIPEVEKPEKIEADSIPQNSPEDGAVVKRGSIKKRARRVSAPTKKATEVVGRVQRRHSTKEQCGTKGGLGGRERLHECEDGCVVAGDARCARKADGSCLRVDDQVGEGKPTGASQRRKSVKVDLENEKFFSRSSITDDMLYGGQFLM